MKSELRKSDSSPRGIRGGIILVCAVVSLVVFFAVRERCRDAGPMPTKPTKDATEFASTEAGPASDSQPPVSGSPARAYVPSRPATAYARQLVKAISRQDHAGVLLTVEEAEKWKASLDQLIARGADGACAIAEFLQTNVDVRLGRPGVELLGVDSVREALFNALVHIGGPEAITATLQTLQTTAVPREIALLARNLDTLAPEVHRQDSLGAAREVMAMAASGKLQGCDVAPLFEVLQNYGGPDIVPELQQATVTWQYYSPIALASLPEGAGIPALAQMVEANGSGTTMALQLLAQLSGKHNDARISLLTQAKAGKIPASAWPFLSAALAGNEFRFQNSALTDPLLGNRGSISTAYVSAGNQTICNAFNPASLTEDELHGRIAFLDQLRRVTTQPAAREAILEADQLLTARLALF